MLTSKLKPHERLLAAFPPNELDIERLRASMEIDGIDKPVEILPDGTVIAGWTRLKAACRLGWKKVPVIVRHDLAKLSEAAVFAYGVRDNLQRRQLSILGQARASLALIENTAGCTVDELEHGQHEQAKAEVAAAMNVSTRTISRWLSLLKLPAELQTAIDNGSITLSQGARIVALPAEDQEQVAAEIAAGTPARAVLKRFAKPKTPARSMAPDQALARLGTVLHAVLPALERHGTDIPAATLHKQFKLLARASTVFAGMIKSGHGAAVKGANSTTSRTAKGPGGRSRRTATDLEAAITPVTVASLPALDDEPAEEGGAAHYDGDGDDQLGVAYCDVTETEALDVSEADETIDTEAEVDDESAFADECDDADGSN